MNKGLQKKKNLLETVGKAGIIMFVLSQFVLLFIISSNLLGLPHELASAIKTPIQFILFITLALIAFFKFKSMKSKKQSSSD